MSDPRSPKSPRKGKAVNLRVTFLNDTVHAFQIHVKGAGHVLWEAIINHLQLLESDYFGLEYTNHNGDECWLDLEKQILKQLPSADTPLRFGVKFYTPDPSLLEDELTRYLFALQVRRDLYAGELHCSENTAALLASYIVQGEIGDFLVDEYVDYMYLASFKFLPQQQQTPEMLQKVMDYHRQHVGESPAEADSNLLDTARKVEMYGIKFHPAKDHEGVALNLAVAHMGVLVFQGMTRINTFSWAKIRKLSFKRKKFLIKLHPESYGYYKDTVEFFFDSRDRCKYFWKKCIEHHTFFRCQTVKKLPRNKARVVSRGSSFRYSGRTQKELQEYVRECIVKRPEIERSVSGRISSRSTSVTPKISAKPSMHNSSDLHNSTASSGSHILETSSSALPPLPPTRLETAEVHSDSSMSGSRSLGSPRLEHGLSADSEGGDFVNQPVDTAAVDARLPHSDSQGYHANNINAAPEARLSSSGFKAKDRKFSAPVFRTTEERPNLEEHRLSRTAEVENIPGIVEEENQTERQNSVSSPTRKSLTRSATEALPDMYKDNFDDLPPPPPPPPQDEYEEDEDEGKAEVAVTIRTKGETTEEEEEENPDEAGQMDFLTPSTNTAADVSSSSIGFPSNISCLSAGLDGDEETKHRSKRRPSDTGYYIVKELLMTERTYKKDLEVLFVWFRQAVSGDPEMLNSMIELIFSRLDPIHDFHCALVKEIDQRLSTWEGRSSAQANGDWQRIGDLLLQGMDTLAELYRNYFNSQEDIVMALDQRVKGNKSFEELYKEFESQKVCYLPLNTFFLKPGQRLLHYRLILERLVKHYPLSHPDASDCTAALYKIKDLTDTYKEKLHRLENLTKLMELQRDLIGLENLVNPDREFLREGCLQKYSRKGYQQRMFFLFSDMLVYTSRAASSLLQFKVHGQLRLRGMTIEETEQSKVAVPNTFAIYSGSRCILVAASSQEEKNKWIEDINNAVQEAAHQPETERLLQYPSLKSSTSSTENIDGADAENDYMSEKPIQHRANTTMHVCWHRNTSVSIYDHKRALKNQLSGYLLRKFKTSNGWQKLWVVFTNFCLFFYKTYQDDFPLASLPLLGYAVNQPDLEDGISKDHVFKLQFKNHVYFFRAESEYTYSRWMEVINSATSSARRTRLFSRMTSTLES